MINSQLPTSRVTRLPITPRPGRRTSGSWRLVQVGSWALAAALFFSASIGAQSRGTTTRRAPAPAAKPPAKKSEPANMMCPQPLGTGVKTNRSFCDVAIERDPNRGIIITLPPHTGAVTLSFDLHNRHLYSEELVKTGRGYRRYTTSIGVMAMDNTLLSLAAIQSEFRTAADLVDRIAGTGAGGLKAVAPTGTESISVMIDAQEEKVSLMGYKLTELRTDGQRDEWETIDRPIAIISNVMVEYTPAPAGRRGATPQRR